jgi:glycerol-3-phosphate dehydrogenase
MPIAAQVERLLRGEITPEEVMRELMTRPLKAE